MGMGPGPRRRRGHRCRTPCLLVALVAAMLVTSGQQPGATAEYPNFRAWCADRATAAASGQPGAAGSDPYTQALKCGGGYKWMIPEGRYNLGIMDGNQARLRAAAHRFIEKGAHLTVGFIGASITAGTYSLEKGPGSQIWPDWSLDILAQHLPPEFESRIHKVNGAVSATNSLFFSMCHQRRLVPDVDVIFVEFAINDLMQGFNTLHDTPQRKATERLIRKLHRYANKPAVVLMNAYSWFVPNCDELNWGSYSMGTLDRPFTEMGQYYNTPVLSVRGCCHSLMVKGVPGFQVYRPRIVNDGGQCGPFNSSYVSEDNTILDVAFFNDWVHPGGRTGCRAMGELAAGVILNAMASLAEKPYGPDDDAQLQAELPPPMFHGNWDYSGQSCFIGDDLKSMVTQQDKFEWTDEGRGKWGLLATTPDASLVLQLSAMVPHESLRKPGQEPTVTLHVMYLCSYEHMGKAQVECISGCKCASDVIDAFQEWPNWSITKSKAFTVTEHPECKISIKVLQETSDPHGEHKFKVMGVTVVEDQDPLFDSPYGHFLAVSEDDAAREQHKVGSGLNIGAHG